MGSNYVCQKYLVKSAFALCVTGVALGVGLADKMNSWSIGMMPCSSPTGISMTNVERPLLTGSDVSDRHSLFVADPFVQSVDGLDYLFFESMDVGSFPSLVQGDIGVAYSDGMGGFRYGGIVIDEDFHLSYPYVFMHQDSHYMVLQSDSDSVRLYKTQPASFPYGWSLESILLEGKPYADPSILHHDNAWWLFVSTNGNRDLELYFSENLDYGWKSHPNNPVIKNDKNITRPGGSVLEHEGMLYRYVQDTSPLYGNSVRIAIITELSKTGYSESIIEKPLLRGDLWGFNALGMHTIGYLGNGLCVFDAR